MNRKYRKTLIAGNWKMNKTAAETRQFAEEIKAIITRARWCDILICVPSVNITAAVKLFKDTKIMIGAQNMHHEPSGAFTGEISARMLSDLGVKYVIVGHSERRAMFGETDITTNKKVLAALEAGLHPIVCVGETLEQRQLGIKDELVTMQVKAALSEVPAEKMRQVVIAYEPIWAIGTGVTASPEEAGEMGTLIRGVIRGKYGARIARSVTIQYGGSMNENNAFELLAQPDVDGGLIGGASLKAEAFAQIIEAANQD